MTEAQYRVHREDYDGWCTTCKKVTNSGGVEPDAHDRECDACGKNTVMGVEEAMVAGLIEFTEK